MKRTIVLLIIAVVAPLTLRAQLTTALQLQIMRAEDSRRYDAAIEKLMSNPSPDVRRRSALAAGRIGNDAALPALIRLLNTDRDVSVRAMAAFAIGEIESVKGADALIKTDSKDALVRGRLVEAAGKIVAAQPKAVESESLRSFIMSTLEFEARRRSAPDTTVIRFGVTAALRANPKDAPELISEFLGYADARVRSDAANALARLRGKSGLERLRTLVAADSDPIVRANAARALGASADKASLPVLLKAATGDADARVRVSAIGAVGALGEKASAAALITHGKKLIANAKQSTTRKVKPDEISELLIIVSNLARLLPVSDNADALALINAVREIDDYSSAETEVAFARIAPRKYVEVVSQFGEGLFAEDWRTMSAVFQGLGAIAGLEKSPENDAVKSQTRVLLVQMMSLWLNSEPNTPRTNNARFAVPALFSAFAAFKSENTSGIVGPLLEDEPDIYIRATLAGILASQPPTARNIEILEAAFTKSMLFDKTSDDATLALMDALYKVDKNKAAKSLLVALNSSDYLVRKKAFELLSDPELEKMAPGIPTMVENAVAKGGKELSTFATGSKLGVLLNTDADYRRALARRNGRVKAILTTTKGEFTINLMPEDAPLTVDNFVKLAKSGYFNGLSVHRVVPNFVMQDGDPRGDGEGGPGWQIRCEVNMLEYARGAVGMALSGKDTGGSQWFVTHSPQPHLDGGYTVFGAVAENDMKIVDRIVRGDRIISVKIIEGNVSAPTQRAPRSRKR